MNKKTREAIREYDFDMLFWSKVKIEEWDECWEWQATKNWGGYGQVRKGKMVLAHRVAWELIFGPIPNEMNVLHKCDNRACCNPNHLFLGTNQDNVNDRVAKGRSARFIGEKHPRVKLAELEVINILDEYKRGISRKNIAQKYNIGMSQLHRIIHGQSWKHIKPKL